MNGAEHPYLPKKGFGTFSAAPREVLPGFSAGGPFLAVMTPLAAARPLNSGARRSDGRASARFTGLGVTAAGSAL